MTTQSCPDCGQAWADKTGYPRLLFDVSKCQTCQIERERRARLWLGDSPAPTRQTGPAPTQQASPVPMLPKETAAPLRSIFDLLDDLADLRITITLNPNDTLTAKPTPPAPLLAELKARRPLVLLMMQVFQQTDADADELGIDDPDEREALRYDNLAWALDAAGEEFEARTARRRAAGAQGLAEAKRQGFFG